LITEARTRNLPKEKNDAVLSAMPRTKIKTEVATMMLAPECRQACEAAAAAERPSLANIFEVTILRFKVALGLQGGPKSPLYGVPIA
jgi:hypothetical protein